MKRFLLALALLLVFSPVKSVVFGSSSNMGDGAAVPQYDLAVSVSPESHHLEGSGSVLIPATDAPRETLSLQLSEQMHDFFVEVLEPMESAGVARLEKNETKSPNPMWTIYPSHPFPPAKPVRLRFTWAGGEKTAFVFYLGTEGSFAGGVNTAWYPQVNGESGTGRLKVSVPVGYTVHATGIARSTSEEMAQGNFLFDAGWPTFFGFVAAKYTVIRGNGAVPMSAYLLRARPNIDEYIRSCARILDVLVKEFGPYPFGDFAIVEVPDEQASRAGFSGASLDGFIMADSTSLDEAFNLAYYGHEIGHQWWGNLIKRKGPRGNAMLDEAMAQYGSLRVVETLEGEAAAEQYRRKGYPGYIATQNGFGYLLRAAAGIDHRLADLPNNGDSHLLADSKGFFVWDMLSRTVGRERFRRILQNFTQRHQFQTVTWEEFLQALERGAGLDLSRFYAQWLERTGVPAWRLAWTHEGRALRIIITQDEPYYEADVEVEVEGDAQQKLRRTIRVSGPRTEITWPLKSRVQSVVLDPHFLILWWTPEYKLEATALASYTRASRTLSEGKFPQALEEFKTALGQLPSPDIYGLQFMLEYGQGMVFYNEKKWSDARSHLMQALASPSRRAEQLPRIYFRLAQVNRELHDETAVRWAVAAAVTADAFDASRTGMARRALALLQSNQQATAQQTVFTGKLLGHDGQPMPKAHAHLLRFNQSKPLASVEVGKDGSFKLETTETGLFRLQFTGVNHQLYETAMLVAKPTEIGLTIRLKTYDYTDDFSDLKIIGDFNDFSFKSARTMEKQSDGTFVAEFETKAAKFTYQLLGLNKSGGSINGTQSEDYIYDGGGDYRSLVTPKDDHVKIIFDPKMLARSETPAQLIFRDENSIAARFASVYQAMLQRRARLHDALVRYKRTGRPLEQFSYDWSSDLMVLATKISEEKDLLLRQALLLSYLDLGFGTYGAKLDTLLAQRAISEIDPASPLWSIEPTLIGVALTYAGQQERYTSYISQVINSHPDPAVAKLVKATLAPERNIVVGKTVPTFSLASLDDPGTTYTSERLKGKLLLIDFWATWCVPCLEEMPNLHREYEKFKGQGFEILSVSLDEKPGIVLEFRRDKWRMPWLHALSDSEMRKRFEVVGIPKAVLVNRDGRIIATDKDLRGPNLDKTLTRVLNAPR